MKEGQRENPSNAATVMTILIVVTFPVPRIGFSLYENNPDMMVPIEIMKEAIPALPIGTPKSVFIMGQGVPSKEAGCPRLINKSV
ncbi:hypothetical protein BK127_38515 [Paenibacillus sp. FSL H7-0331]|nr:hypothetical protein BK127_38515 [Paenibacillus sp. FSL H7-0331]